MAKQNVVEKLEQVLIIEPENELRFKGPFNVPVTSYMKLKNPTDKHVLFKIKTTAPKKYCVRPNSGALEPDGAADIAICLQPFVFDPNEKNKHKFMVQTMFTTLYGATNVEQMFKDTDEKLLMDSKLKCVFEMPMNESNDNIEDSVTVTSTKANASTTETVGVESDLEKATEEVQQLRKEESSLRQENLRLKEEILQLKVASGQRLNQPNRYAPPPPQQNVPMMVVALSVVMALVGIVLGKYIL